MQTMCNKTMILFVASICGDGSEFLKVDEKLRLSDLLLLCS